MLVCYHRSSSLGQLEFCEQKFFLQYNLSLRDKTNRKALLGTVVHRALQLLADKNLAQKNKVGKVVNDDIPNLSYKKCDDLPHITELCFDYYAEHEPEVELTKADLRTCIRWVQKAVAYNDGELDPRNQNVHATELFFDIEIKKPWAKYSYDVGGEKIEGYLSIKGTIDLITQEDDKYFQVLDYKTGKRIDWATGEIKTPEKLQKDTQLLLYYYALKNMYPDWEFFVSIYYINDSKIDGVDVPGGLFSMVFDEEDYQKAEDILRQKFEYIRSVEQPRLLSSENTHWKCKYLCKFSEEWENSGKSTCHFFRDMVKSQGIVKTIEQYGDIAKISKYGDGGGRLAEDRVEKDK